MSDFGITVNITREVIREEILGAIKELQDEEGFDMRDIISELLSIASAAVTRLDDINEVTISTLGEELDASDVEDEYDEEAVKRLRVIELREEFENSDINKQIQSLLEKRSKLSYLQREIDAIKVDEEILSLLPEHVMRWNKTVGSDEYADYADVEIGTVETLMRAYVALLDKDGLELVKSTVLQLNQQIQFMDQEIFDMDYSRFYKDVATMSAIYEHLRNNPQFPQKDLFKTLSIDGRKAIYMLNWAERLGRISRIRHKGTWLLSISNSG